MWDNLLRSEKITMKQLTFTLFLLIITLVHSGLSAQVVDTNNAEFTAPDNLKRGQQHGLTSEALQQRLQELLKP